MNGERDSIYVWLHCISLCFHVTLCGFIGLTGLSCLVALCDFTGFCCDLIQLYFIISFGVFKWSSCVFELENQTNVDVKTC